MFCLSLQRDWWCDLHEGTCVDAASTSGTTGTQSMEDSTASTEEWEPEQSKTRRGTRRHLDQTIYPNIQALCTSSLAACMREGLQTCYRFCVPSELALRSGGCCSSESSLSLHVLHVDQCIGDPSVKIIPVGLSKLVDHVRSCTVNYLPINGCVFITSFQL